MDLAKACFHLRNRRMMYLMDDRYETTVAFIVGLSWASDGRPLEGFNDWVAERVLGHRSPRVWWSIIRDGDGTGEPLKNPEATSLLLDLLEEFISKGNPISDLAPRT